MYQNKTLTDKNIDERFEKGMDEL